MDANSQDENGENHKVNDGMNHNGLPIGVEAAKFYKMIVSRNLEQQPRRQKYEQN